MYNGGEARNSISFTDQRTTRTAGKGGVCQGAATERLGKQAGDGFRRALCTRWGPLDFITIDPHDDSHVQRILTVRTFDICKVSYSLKCTWKPKINSRGAFATLHTHGQGSKNLCA